MLECDLPVLSSSGPAHPEEHSIAAHLPPEPAEHDGEISRYIYRRGGEAVMLVIRLMNGAEKRYYRDLTRGGQRWLSDPQFCFNLPFYNGDALIDEALKGEPVFYVETEAEADALIERGILAITFGSPSAFPRYQGHALKGREVIALGSNSDVGFQHAATIHGEYGEVASWINSCIVESPLGQTEPGYGVLDWIRDIGSAPDLNERFLQEYWLGQAPPKLKENSNPADMNTSALDCRFLVKRPYRGMAKPQQRWVVDGVLPATGTAILFGEGGVGKSFVASEIAFAIQNGRDFGGRKTLKGEVIYFAVEDGDGLMRRTLEALDRDPALEPYGIISRELDLSARSSDTDLLIEDLEKQFSDRPIRLIVIDTLQMALGDADESSANAATAIMRHCNRISERLGCLVLVVHHTGKDASRGHRGSSAFHGAATTMLKMDRSEASASVTIEKQKHGRRGLRLNLHLEAGDDDRTCRVVIDGEWAAGKSRVKNTGNSVLETELLGILKHNLVTTGSRTMSRTLLRDHAISLSCLSDKGEEAVKSQVNRAISVLCDRGTLSATRSSVTLIEGALHISEN